VPVDRHQRVEEQDVCRDALVHGRQEATGRPDKGLCILVELAQRGVSAEAEHASHGAGRMLVVDVDRVVSPVRQRLDRRTRPTELVTFRHDVGTYQRAFGLAANPVAIMAALAAVRLAPVRSTSMDRERIDPECSLTAPAPLHTLRNLRQRLQLVGTVLTGPGRGALATVGLQPVAGG